MNIFEQAVRTKHRVPTAVGNLSVEQLIDLPITSKKGANLSDIARQLQADMKSLSIEELTALRR